MKGKFSTTKKADYIIGSTNWYQLNYGHSSGQKLYYLDEDNNPLCRFYMMGFPYQCGAIILAGFLFYSEKTTWAKDFTADLNELCKNRKAKIIASAVNTDLPTPGGDDSLLYDLLVAANWERGSDAKNPNSGNIITIFEHSVENDDADEAA